MKKMLLILSILVLFSIGASAPWPTAKLILRNRTSQTFYLSLEQNYYFEIKPYTEVVYEVARKIYYTKASACGVIWYGVLDARRNLKLTVPPCALWQNSAPLWLGEPRMEKINPLLKPGLDWRFFY